MPPLRELVMRQRQGSGWLAILVLGRINNPRSRTYIHRKDYFIDRDQHSTTHCQHNRSSKLQQATTIIMRIGHSEFALSAFAILFLAAASAFTPPRRIQSYRRQAVTLSMSVDFKLDPKETAFVFIEYQNEFTTVSFGTWHLCG